MFERFRSGGEDRLRRRTLARWRARLDVARRVEEVLALDPAEVGQKIDRTAPRSLPGNPEFVKSGWTEHMLLRYFLAMDVAAGKKVLDSCCGLGWGTHLVASVAGSVTGIDIDPPSIAFCRSQWRDENADFVEGSVLDLPFSDESFDVVLCMEAIEHFRPEDGRRYLEELRRVCRPGGALVGSSAFPASETAARELCAQNPHHLHIYTAEEMRRLLGEVFSGPTRLTTHYFAAKKPG